MQIVREYSRINIKISNGAVEAYKKLERDLWTKYGFDF